MNTIQKGIITLVRSALLQQPLKLPASFRIEDAIAYLRCHHIQPLCYEGAVLCGVSKSSKAMQQLFKTYCSGVVIAARQDEAVRKLLSAFEENGIDYIPLKGSRMRPIYPKPELRTMCDADILIRPEQYPRIPEILQGLGYTFYAEGNHDYSWRCDSLFLELHYCLLAIDENSFVLEYSDGWSAAHQVCGFRYAMKPEDELIYLFCHFAKHYAAGIGIRYVADLWMYLRNHPNLDNAYIDANLEKLELLGFYRNVKKLIAVWFEDDESDSKSEVMADYIFASGSTGTREDTAVSRILKNSKKSSMGRHFAHTFLCFLFPSRLSVETTFPVVRKRKWLYAPMLIIRPFYRMFKDKNALKRWITVIKSYDAEKVDAKRLKLEFVDFPIK